MDKIFLYREEAFYTHHQKSSFQLKKERKKEGKRIHSELFNKTCQVSVHACYCTHDGWVTCFPRISRLR